MKKALLIGTGIILMATLGWYWFRPTWLPEFPSNRLPAWAHLPASRERLAREWRNVPDQYPILRDQKLFGEYEKALVQVRMEPAVYQAYSACEAFTSREVIKLDPQLADLAASMQALRDRAFALAQQGKAQAAYEQFNREYNQLGNHPMMAHYSEMARRVTHTAEKQALDRAFWEAEQRAIARAYPQLKEIAKANMESQLRRGELRMRIQQLDQGAPVPKGSAAGAEPTNRNERLTLQGIMWGKHPTIMLNGKYLETGETAEIALTKGNVLVKCVEIHKQEAILQINSGPLTHMAMPN